MANFRPVDRGQVYLLPPSLSDWLGEGDLAFFVVDAVDQMNLAQFLAGCRSDGRGGASYHPSVMVALLVYAYCRGVSSSREIERRCRLDVGFRVVSAQQMPDHTTIARFRRGSIKPLGQLFVQVLELCAAAGLVKLGSVSLDSTRMGANAAMESNLTRKRLRELVEKMLGEAEAADALEDKLYGEGKRGDELPAHLAGREERLRHLRAAREKLARAERAKERAEEQARAGLDRFAEKKKAHQERADKSSTGKSPGTAPTPPAAAQLDNIKANTTDPDSRIHRSRQGYCQGYNAQALVTEDQIIVGAQVVDAGNDMHQLGPMIGHLHTALTEAGLCPGEVKAVLADSGYWTPQSVTGAARWLRARAPATELLVAAPPRWAKFKEPPRPGESEPPGLGELGQIEWRQKSPPGQRIYAKRARTVEPVFGQIKAARGLRRFMLRGLELVAGEWKLITASHNLLKLWRHGLAPAHA